jgi:uncharacterized protein with PQ loop repeat
MTIKKHKHILWKWWFDTSLTYGGLLGSMITLPQAYGIWVNHNADGVSLIYWLGYLFGNSIWLAYGIVHKEKPIIFTYVMAVPMAIIIVTGIILYR